MKPKFLIFILVLFIFTGRSLAQSGYEMKEGETISVDVNGNILHSNMPNSGSSKVPAQVTVSNVEKNSIYHDNGRFKIPGYVPSDNPADDEESYKTAKYMLYQKNPQEFEKWFGSTPANTRVIVRSEEFQKMPDIKKQQILANPAKYYIEDSNINPDCNHK